MWSSDQAAAGWQRGAEARARFFGPATALMLDLAGVSPGNRVLDVAAGAGDQTLAAASRIGPTGTILATDVSTEMLAYAADAARRAGLTNVETRVMDAQRLELELGSFDAAISRHSLSFIPDLQAALVGIRGALRPGAKLAAMVWGAPEANPFMLAWAAMAHLPGLLLAARSSEVPGGTLSLTAALRSGLIPSPPADRPGTFALGSPDLLEAAFRRAGFRDVAVHVVPTPRRFESLEAALRYLREVQQPLERKVGLREAEQALAWAALARTLRQFEGPTGFEAPGESLIAVGTS